MPRLSSPISKLADHYEIVVVGSGYGGGIAASRLARAGRDVCLLERGRERWPGEFPDTAAEAFRELQIHTAEADHGPANGLFMLHADRDISVFSGCGLGGTSLINANVALDADPRVWEQPCWPPEIRTDADRLREARERAWTMLNPEVLTRHREPKLQALALAAERTGRAQQFRLTPLTVTFEDRVNAAGVQQKECTRCGDCCSGCNNSAKTTTLLTYVADAFAHGAQIFTEVSVHHLSRRPSGGWVVHLDFLGVGRERFDGPHAFVTADTVVVSAGVLGSTEILLRSAEDGRVALSNRIGKSFSGNGDVLAFAYDCNEEINGVGWGDDPHFDDMGRWVGPCITGVVDDRAAGPLADGHVIEEGAIPGPLAFGMPTALAAAAAFDSKISVNSPEHPFHRALATMESLFGGARVGAVARTLTYLVMGHDNADGEVVLEGDRLRVHWDGVADKDTFSQTDDRLAELTNALGGRYIRDPLWSENLTRTEEWINRVPIVGKLWWHRRLRTIRQLGPVRRLKRRKQHFGVMTVHPLGGCAIGASAESGVVDHASRVFSGTRGTDVYDDLFVMDGSIVPTSLGVNPLLTISTLSERACELICERKGWPFEKAPAPKTELIDLPEPPAGVQFTETMHGTVRIGRDEVPISFLLTIEVDDVEALVEDPARVAGAAGTVSIRRLSPQPLTVVDGTFRLFVEDDSASEVQHMEYRLPVVAQDGARWFVEGTKTLGTRSILHAWRDTTTLAVRVHEGSDAGGPLVATGTMRLDAADFVHQLCTITATGARTEEQRRRAVEHYVRLFGDDIFEHYLGLLGPEQLFDRAGRPRRRRALAAPTPEPHDFTADDGLTLRLTRYHGGDKGPVLLAHGMGVSSGIFSTDLIDTNLVEYLVANQYDVWLLDFRVSTALASAARPSNSDQIAQYDHPAAVRCVLDLTQKSSLQAVVHCYGSNTFVMSMLRGWTPSGSVRSLVCSQVATHLEMGPAARLKAGLHTPDILDALGVESLTAYVDADSNWRQRLLDDALRLNPVPKGERCNSAVCHRITFLFSLLYEHANLGDRLHDNLHELFGVVNIAGMEHLSTMVRHGHVVDVHGHDAYLTDENVGRLALPTLLLSGGKNECYHPSSTQSTYELLASANGADLYRRTVIPHYGHIDCIFGAAAVDDVYPSILEHLEAT